MIILIISAATGRVTKGLQKNIESISGTHSMESLQNTATLGSSHITESTTVSNRNPEG